MTTQTNHKVFSWLTLGVLLVCSSGCQQRTAGELHGRWVGKPDSAAAKTAREAEKYGDDPPQAQADATLPKQATDWEAIDVQVELNFVSGSALELSLAGLGSKVQASWSIIETSPTGCTIEVVTATSTAEDGTAASERRRFELLFDERDGTLVGFELSEVGADRQVGALYFQRAK